MQPLFRKVTPRYSHLKMGRNEWYQNVMVSLDHYINSSRLLPEGNNGGPDGGLNNDGRGGNNGGNIGRQDGAEDEDNSGGLLENMPSASSLWLLVAVAVTIVVALTILCIIVKRVLDEKAERDFQLSIDKTRSEIEHPQIDTESASSSSEYEEVPLNVDDTRNYNRLRLKPYSGKYKLSFTEETGIRYNAVLTLNFIPEKERAGYTISGGGSDKNGETQIEGGFLHYDNSAWWHERTAGRRLEVLSQGKFDFQERTFEGTWLTNSGKTGSYETFCAVESNEAVV